MLVFFVQPEVSTSGFNAWIVMDSLDSPLILQRLPNSFATNIAG